MADSPAFLDHQTPWENAASIVLPVPFERTTSYGRGTREGPAAILAASTQVELWDEELGVDPARQGVHTAPPCDPRDADLGDALEAIEVAAGRHLGAGKFLVVLGGEHSLSIGPVRAAAAVHGEIGVVQLDAHADLRDTYEGTPHSHACVMRRIIEQDLPTLAVGIRSLSLPEAELIRRRGLPTIWGYQLDEAEERFADHLAGLPERIYLTFDLDFFDPALAPGTGTPEPGGGSWYPTLRLLHQLFRSKRVVAMDVVELMPIAGQPASDFVAARLIAKCLAYRGENDRS